MLTALDAPDQLLDDVDRRMVALVREHGWVRTSVFKDDEGLGFSYTTGFWITARRPEVIMFGMQAETAHDVFWDLFRDHEAGRSLPIGTRTDNVFANLPAYAFPVAKRHYPDFLGRDLWFYAGDDFPCLQIVWPDRASIFPWERGFDTAFADEQPDLTENGWVASLAD